MHLLPPCSTECSEPIPALPPAIVRSSENYEIFRSYGRSTWRVAMPHVGPAFNVSSVDGVGDGRPQQRRPIVKVLRPFGVWGKGVQRIMTATCGWYRSLRLSCVNTSYVVGCEALKLPSVLLVDKNGYYPRVLPLFSFERRQTQHPD